MKIVVGLPIKQRAWCLPDWFQALESQGIDHEVICVYTTSTDDTEQILKDHGAIIYYDEAEGRSQQDMDYHAWGRMETYEYITGMRNFLCERAQQMGADYFFSLDSDIILSDGVLPAMLEYAQTHEGVISPAVNMIIAKTAWNVMEWVNPQQPNRAHRGNPHPRSGKADVIMAAMLLDKLGMQCKWVAHGQGEDVGFCIDAEEKGIPRWWLGDLRCQHRMWRFN